MVLCMPISSSEWRLRSLWWRTSVKAKWECRIWSIVGFWYNFWHWRVELNRYRPNVTADETVNLLTNTSTLMTHKKKHEITIISYWIPMMHMFLMPETKPLRGGQIPPQMKNCMELPLFSLILRLYWWWNPYIHSQCRSEWVPPHEEAPYSHQQHNDISSSCFVI